MLFRSQYVSDPENIIRFREQAQLNRLLGELRDSLHIETAIVVLPAIDRDRYDSTRKFANKLFNTWGIGDKQTNRGLLIVLLTNDEAREIVRAGPLLFRGAGALASAAGRAADSGWSGASGFALRRATPFLSIIFIFN